MERNLKLFAFCFLMAVGAPHTQFVEAQTLKKEIRIEADNQAMPQVLKQLEKKSGYKILFTNDDLNQFRVSVDFKTKDIRDALNAIIGNRPLEYTIRQEGNYVSIRLKNTRGAARRANQQAAQAFEMIHVSGTVIDAGKSPIPGVHIEAVGTDYRCISDMTGQFHLNLPKGQPFQLRFSFVGMQTVTSREYDARYDVERLYVTMAEDQQQLDEVVVTGMFERKKESFTGSSTTFSKDDLMAVGNQNLIKSLKNLDPAFQIVENLEMGSNPNAMPEIQMRGETSFNIQGDYDGNANQPLFILDGFETTLEKIWDLDMNRVQSVTLLKDAAAKAIYGSKAGNGVVVIETIRPKSGEMRISYSGSLDLEVPDLSDYNLMNAREKYQWELDHNRYTNWAAMNSPMYADLLNKSVYDAIASGVDTYWLSQPLETVFAHRHGINLEGGTNELRYKIYAGLNQAPGIMKGTGVYGKSVSIDIRYRYKGLLISNIAYVDYTTSDRTSPYGTFDQYAKLNPYYRIRDEHGQIQQYLEKAVYDDSGFNSAGMTVGNPMYNTLYNSIDRNVAFEVRDAFRAEYSPMENLRLAMDLTVTKTTSDTDIFKSANHTDFIEVTDLEERGSYQWTNATTLDWDLAFTASYNKVWQNRHVLATYFRYNIKETKDHSAGAYATGFPNDNMDEVFLGAKVQENVGDENTTRSFGGVATLSYTYDQKYAADINGRLDASSEFGSENRYAPFWSAGLRWNLDKESWIQRLGFVDELVLRGTYGVTGEQGFTPYQALQMYNYTNTMRIYQSSDVVGTLLYGMGNPELKWQTTDSWNIGLDFTLFNNRLSGRFEYYNKLTKNTVLDYSLAPSIGFSTIKDNVGNISNKGYEFTLRYMPYYNVAQQMNLSFVVNGSHNKNTIEKISNALRARNEEQMKEDPDNPNKLSRPLPRYEEGYSQSMIWAVRSLGIDPITGREVFLTRDGERTSEWNAADQVPVGDTEPDLQGTMSLNFNWKGLSVNVAAQYKFGGQYYNKTLVDKVENADLRYNVDHRAYTDRWQNVGDLAVFKAVTQDVNGSQTKASTRFLMDQNELVLNTINIQYRFEQRYTPWIKRLGLSSASVGLYMEDLFHWSTIRQERGIEYPMSRQISMSLNLTF